MVAYIVPMQLKIFDLPIFRYACLADLQSDKYRGYAKALGVYKARWREGVKIPYFCVYILNG